MKKYLFFLTIAVLILACSKDDPIVVPEEAKGSIFVTVKFFGQIVSDAQVTTEPASSMVETDLTGTALISMVPIGGYKVNAFHPNIGSGSASVTVTENAVMDVTINLIGGVFENPSVDIISPNNGSVHNLGDEVSYSGNVGDSEDNPNTLSIEWKSSKDGVLNTNSANASGNSMFTTSSLSEGDHEISLKVTDSDMLETQKKINISVKRLPDAVVLNSIEETSDGLSLSWSTSTESEFANYRVLRSEDGSGNFEAIEVISDLNMTNYTDNNISFGRRYYYQVVVVLNNGDESFSNIESFLYEGENIDVGVNVVRMILDPVRPYIYALDNINNSLLFINKETKEVEKSIFVGSSPSDIDIKLDNSKAFIANYGSSQLAVVDLESQEKTGDIFVDDSPGSWDGNPYRIACVGENRIAWVTKNSWATIRLVNDANGQHIMAVNSSYSAPAGLLTNKEQTILYVTEAGSSGSAAHRLNYVSNLLEDVDESDASSNYAGHDACISGDDKYLFYNRFKLLANNLSSQIGTFSEYIVASNNDGSIGIGTDNIWDAETFSIIKPLPVSSTIILLDDDDNTLYIYDNNSSKIYLSSIN